MNYIFPLAPMSPLIKILTIILLLLPGIILLFSPKKQLAVIICLVIILVYASVWVWFRPSQFIISSESLEIIFPARQLTIPKTNISSVKIISQKDFERDFGWSIRIGAGGLWGGFGWLWTSKKGFLEFYISQMDEFVMIEKTNGEKLMITPKDSLEFVGVLNPFLPFNE